MHQALNHCLTDVPGIEVGHCTDARRPTGCTVVLARQGAIAGVDVRGAAPGTRETDLLTPGNLVDKVHAVLLSGGSVYGLDAASGVMRWLEQNDIGLNVAPHPHDAARRLRVPIVPAAVLYDLWVGDGSIRPDADSGYRACAAASCQPHASGNVGAGAGATVGKLFGTQHAMKGGVGSASLRLHGVTVAALVACNAVGDVLHPHTGELLAGARCAADSSKDADAGTRQGSVLRNTRQALLRGELPQPLLAGTNTTIGVIATDALLTPAQAKKLAQIGHDGLARSINPVHTQLDGDTLFALATGASGLSVSPLLLAVMAAEVVALAVVNAIETARSVQCQAQPSGQLLSIAARHTH
ncbi:MAG: P1 family peptidase [Burkholderiales bacterium]